MKSQIRQKTDSEVRAVDIDTRGTRTKGNPPRIVMALAPKCETIRLPGPRERDPVFGLTRSYMNDLILPSKRNGFRILVKSFLLLRPGNKKGVRLVDLESLRDYVHRQVQVSNPVEPVEVPTAGQIKEELRRAA